MARVMSPDQKAETKSYFGGIEGEIYLIHFNEPYGHARHYLGWTQNLDRRLRQHNCGAGANLMKVATTAGVDWELVRTWHGDRNLERRLKNRGGHARLCPACQAEKKAQKEGRR